MLFLAGMEAAPAPEPQPFLLTSLFLTLFLAGMEAASAPESRPPILTSTFLT